MIQTKLKLSLAVILLLCVFSSSLLFFIPKARGLLISSGISNISYNDSINNTSHNNSINNISGINEEINNKVSFNRILDVKGNNVLVRINIMTSEEITFYEIVPKGCEVGAHQELAFKNNMLYYKISMLNTPLTWDYELLCNQGNHIITGYYSDNLDNNLAFEDTNFSVRNISPKPIPVYLWIFLLLVLIVFFIVTLISEEV